VGQTCHRLANGRQALNIKNLFVHSEVGQPAGNLFRGCRQKFQVVLRKAHGDVDRVDVDGAVEFVVRDQWCDHQ